MPSLSKECSGGFVGFQRVIGLQIEKDAFAKLFVLNFGSNRTSRPQQSSLTAGLEKTVAQIVFSRNRNRHYRHRGKNPPERATILRSDRKKAAFR
jgi:hypothetical protein